MESLLEQSQTPVDETRPPGTLPLLGASRREEPWTPENESLLRRWGRDWLDKDMAHGNAARRKRKLHLCLAVPATLAPLFLAPLVNSKWLTEDSWMVTAGLILASCCSGLQTLFNFSGTSEKHANASARYADLVSDVDELMCKARRYRPDVDVTICNFKHRSDALQRYAPDVCLGTSRSCDAPP